MCPAGASLFSSDALVPAAGRWSCRFEKWRHLPAVVVMGHGLVSDDRVEQLLMRVVVEAILFVWRMVQLSCRLCAPFVPSLPLLRVSVPLSVTRFPGNRNASQEQVHGETWSCRGDKKARPCPPQQDASMGANTNRGPFLRSFRLPVSFCRLVHQMVFGFIN